MADTRYTLTYRDPETGADKTVNIKLPDKFTPEKAQQLVTAVGESVGVSPEAISLTKVGEKRPPLPPSSAEAKTVGPSAGERAVTMIGESAPYAGLGLINPAAASLRAVPAVGAWLAKHPKMVSGILRSLGAGGIGGTEAAIKGEDVGQAAKGSGLVQAGLEVITPPIFKAVRRVGGGAMRKAEDAMASQLMTKIKAAVPWLKGLPDSHEGLHALLVSGEGPAKLSQHYGAALSSIQESIPKEALTILSMEDAAALNAPIAKVSGQEGKLVALVPTHKLINLVSGVWKKDPDLSRRTLEALDQSLPEIAGEQFAEARRLFREGTSFTKTLKAAHAIDEGTGRLNVERVTMALRGLFGTPGEAGTSILERYVKPTHAPESAKMLKEAVPPTGKTPHAAGIGKFYATPWGHIGLAGEGGRESVKSALSQTQPSSILWSGNIPLTGTEEAVKKWLPGAIHAFTTGTGVTP